ncbi:MAG: hypothetical protein DMG70_11745 [Acidobacteria bacterium]|nr:MAG: hypothetical protein DMG70_11745 [Acidobacteriota bacterium]PYY08832.1 MAG: hypothetical protein DMG69_13180 [Acidobacteriota bacterium]
MGANRVAYIPTLKGEVLQGEIQARLLSTLISDEMKMGARPYTLSWKSQFELFTMPEVKRLSARQSALTCRNLVPLCSAPDLGLAAAGAVFR